eukprot:c27591_g1_i4 orf=363-1454(-)
MNNYVIQYALALVLKESFKLYCAINDGIINLVDKFFEMQRHDAMKALDIYRRAGQQAERLTEFYDVCKHLELARSFQFPSLAQPPQSFLLTMEEYVKEAPRGLPLPSNFADYNEETSAVGQLRLTYHASVEGAEQEASPNTVVAPPVDICPPSPPSPPQDSMLAPVSDSNDLLGLDVSNPDATGLEQSNALALAIVSSEPTSNGKVASYDQSGGLNLESGVTGWELALVTAPSSNESALNKSKLAGGLDKLTLDGLYEHALTRHSTGADIYPNINNPFITGSALQSGQLDPFVASSKVAPPPNVQMAVMAQQQQAFILQQHQNVGASPVANPFGNPYTVSYPYGVQTSENQYQNNPFGNPGLL